MSPAKPILILLAVALLCPGLPCFIPGTLSASGGPNHGEVRLLFAGDILLSRGVELQLSHNLQAFVRALRPAFSTADLVVGNLEGAVGSPDDCHSSETKPCFPIRTEFIPLLKEAGFRAISLANNHSGDLGAAARQTTRRMLAASGILPLTYDDSPQFIRFKDLTFALIALPLTPGRDEPAVDIPDTVLRQKLRMARNLADMVVVYVHWGSEFLDWPDKRQRHAARWLIQNGADLIVGHHPHMIQKPESIDGKAVFFSLGNLVFDQKYPSTREGLLADCRIQEGIATFSAFSTRTPPGSTLPIFGDLDADSGKVLSGCAFRLRPPLEVGGITIRPVSSTQGERPSGFLLEGNHGGGAVWKTRHARIVSIEKMQRPASQSPSPPARSDSGAEHPREYLFTLERHFSPLDREQGLRPCVYETRPDGLAPVWRGSALAWPLVDAAFLPGNREVLCALHRGDSFLAPHPQSKDTRVAAYRWKGFGFSGIHDEEVIMSCREFLQ